MRALILIAGLALALGACGNNDQKDNNQNVDENLSAENIVSNDVTAIDAVTADAANMAADMPVDELNAVAPENNPSAPPTAARPKPKAMTAPAKPETDTAPAPTNSAENTQ
jgi:hypothetical protein